ncbi:hypothetical protein A5756_23460 [Mycobacterium sp. 852002-53434_SCH5985345]|uniref:PAS domain-containing protein n=1 Tax=Mycobacterium sp. 852002-53434_SCH5985345 TaxID=1834107 RepID=UPI0007FB9BB8|nr:PAS domain-containing protein [Mycobacterium sp. 852002-53434_SCH5985345]OBF49666.1 hypothetical protein A5756_23460 [Mycobacterium sp. 852002-53434_SCH5985345]
MLSASRVSAIEESAWFQSKWAPYLLTDADLRIRAVNPACERVSGHPREGLLGHQMFDVFPDNPRDPEADGVANASASLELVLRRGIRHWLGVQRYDIPDWRNPGEFVYKVWTPVNSPIKEGKKTVAVLQHAQDITRVLPPAPTDRAYPKLLELRSAAEVLGRQFPDLPLEAVLSVLAHSHSVIMESAGVEDLKRAEALAKLRLETHAGHPAEGP